MFFEKMIRPWNDGLFLRIGVVQNEDVIPNSLRHPKPLFARKQPILGIHGAD